MFKRELNLTWFRLQTNTPMLSVHVGSTCVEVYCIGQTQFKRHINLSFHKNQRNYISPIINPTVIAKERSDLMI